MGPGDDRHSCAKRSGRHHAQCAKGQTDYHQSNPAAGGRHGATIGCPIATGILARIAAGAAGEDEADGKKRITPYWRTLKSGGELNPKYPGGLTGQRARLREEGHTITSRGKRLFVKDYERSVVKLK